MSLGLECYAVVVPGLEPLAMQELQALGAGAMCPDEGGVAFRASPDAVMRIAVRARCITRVLLRLCTFQAASWPRLRDRLQRIDWSAYVGGRAVQVHVSSRRSRLWHTGRIAEMVEQAVAGVASPGAEEQVHVYLRIVHDRCQVSLCASAERMDRRGYRLEPGHAPLRETIAAALLDWSGWTAAMPLYVPMCGSGVWAIEAAWMARRIAPNAGRTPPCVGWPGFPQRRWLRVQEKTAGMQRDCHPCIHASDLDAAVVALARRNAERAGVADCVRPEQADLFDVRPAEGTRGILLLNPPYGRRIGLQTERLYARIGQHVRRHFASWQVLVITPNPACERTLGLPPVRRLKFRHGGTWVHALAWMDQQA